MNAHEIIAEAMPNLFSTTNHPMGEALRRELADIALDALCPPGALVAIDRRPQPCPECEGGAVFFGVERTCPRCRGQRTVDGDRIRGLRRSATHSTEFDTYWRLVDVEDPT